MNKAGIARRIHRAGLRDAAEAYREEVRHRIAQTKGGRDRNRDEVSLAAWTEMWETFRPAVEHWEKTQKEQEKNRVLSGCTDNLEPFLDPDYSEQDPGKWIRDGLIWTAAEIRRVVRDSNKGATVDLARAKTPPPTAWAVFCLEYFAYTPPAKRGELIARVLPFATRSYEAPKDETPEEPRDDGFLDDIS